MCLLVVPCLSYHFQHLLNRLLSKIFQKVGGWIKEKNPQTSSSTGGFSFLKAGDTFKSWDINLQENLWLGCLKDHLLTGSILKVFFVFCVKLTFKLIVKHLLSFFLKKKTLSSYYTFIHSSITIVELKYRRSTLETEMACTTGLHTPKD